MRVVLFTAEEPLYLPRYLAPVLSAHADAIEAVVLAPPERGTVTAVRRQVRMLGLRDALRFGALVGRGRLLDALPAAVSRRFTDRYHSVRAVADAHDVPVWRTRDVNAASFVARVRELDPDVLLSVVCGQKLGPDLLSVPDTALNLHGSLLPNYRGRAVAFWPLYYGDEETGVTAHLMTEEWDAGPIVERRRVPVADDTMHDLSLKLADAGSELAVDLLDRLADGAALETRPNETTPDDYHTVPTPEERREFRRRGNEFL